MTLTDYFWDRWPYFAGKLSWNITTTQANLALHPFGVARSKTSFGLGKGGKVTATRWQVTLCDPIWHVISRSGVVISITNCYILTWVKLRFIEPLVVKGPSSVLGTLILSKNSVSMTAEKSLQCSWHRSASLSTRNERMWRDELILP